MPTNQRLAHTMYTLSADGVCGASLMALSVVLSAPGRDNQRQGAYVVMVTNATSNVPLHVQARVVFTDARDTSATAIYMDSTVSNPHAFGGSAMLGKGLYLLLSGEGAAIPLQNLAGSVLQVWLLAASNTASAVVTSGAVAVWRV